MAVSNQGMLLVLPLYALHISGDPAYAALVVALRNVPDALTHAPFNAALGEHLKSAHRATFLSLLNLAGRVALSVLLSGLAWWLAPQSTADWPTLSALLVFCATLGCAALALLALSVKAITVRRK